MIPKPRLIGMLAMLLCMLAVLPLAGLPALAGTTGKITGRVVNASTREPLPSISIMVTGTTMGAATDIEGNYLILNIPPGKYTLRASAVGYKPVQVDRVVVSMDLTTTIGFQLEESAIQVEDQVVIAQRPLVTRDLTASTAVIDAEQFAALPVTDFQEVLELKAGMVGGTVRGGRVGEIVYAIDGVPMTDVYDGSTVVDVNPNAIQELQFVSGAFNAEYGRALSAYVNIATKDGDQHFAGSFTSYAGGHLSSHTGIFRGISRFDPLGVKNFEATASGPVIPDLLTFFVNGRYNDSDGWLFGRRLYEPWDITINRGSGQPAESRYIIQQTGDGAIVPMNWSEKIYAHGKLSCKPVPTITLSFNTILDRLRYQDYDHMYSYNPDGMLKRFRTGLTDVLAFTHTLSPAVFYQANFSYFLKEYKHYVYEDVNDPRYTHYRLLTQQPRESPSFLTGGTDPQHFRRTTSSLAFKYDLTAQVSQTHLVKGGVDLSFHTLTFDEFNLLQSPGIPDPAQTLDPFVPVHVPDPGNPEENLSIDRYRRKPVELSAYLQDKIELNELIINLGLRYDYFAPDGQVLQDPSDPDIYRPLKPDHIAMTMDQRRAVWYRKATPKSQFSPRLGVAFPVTDRGVVHFSYGHFFQVPNFEYLYVNPEYKFGTGSGNLGIAGNPDLKPEQTIIGEVGVQQALTEDLSFDLTGYFRNIRNLTGTRADEIQLFGGSGRYSQFVNSDFGFVRGVVLTLTKRLSNNWSATLDYTLQTVKGNASDPAATWNQLVGGLQPEIQLIPLNWDQRHTLNVTFTYASPDQWGVSLIGHEGSGFPYTPNQSMNISELLTNSELKPSTFSVDLRANKDFRFGNMLLTLFARVFNLFDAKNQLDVYSDTGTADFTLDEYRMEHLNLPPLVNTVGEFYTNPLFYSEPRRVEVGLSLFFN